MLFSSMLLEIMGIRQLKTHSHVFKPKGFADWNIFLEFVTCWCLLDRERQVKRVQERVVMVGIEKEREVLGRVWPLLCVFLHILEAQGTTDPDGAMADTLRIPCTHSCKCPPDLPARSEIA